MVDGFSIIVCCHNSSNRIVATLEHICGLEVPENLSVELIIVDNNSSDQTAQVVLSTWKRLASLNASLGFSIIYEKKPGLAFAREKGISHAKNNYVIFCDDDNSLLPDYLTEVQRVFNMDSSIAAVGGQGFFDEQSYIPEQIRWYTTPFAIGPQQPDEGYRPHSNPWLYGAGLALDLRKYRNAVRLFPHIIASGRIGKSLLGGDDNEICYKLVLAGYKLYYNPNARFVHCLAKSRLNVKYFFKLMRHLAISNAHLSPYLFLINGFKQGSLGSDNFSYRLFAYMVYKGLLSGIRYFLSGKRQYYVSLVIRWYLFWYKWEMRDSNFIIRGNYSKLKESDKLFTD